MTTKPKRKTKPKKNPDIQSALLDSIVYGLQEVKGKDITIINLKNIDGAVSDYYVIASGDSSTQVDALAYSVEEEVRKATGQKPWHAEGFENCEWILVDYVDVVVHIFQREQRDFYRLEDLWADSEITKIETK